MYFLGPRIISELSSHHCHFIDVPLTLEDTSKIQAHKIILSLVSDYGQFLFLDCFLLSVRNHGDAASLNHTISGFIGIFFNLLFGHPGALV